MKTMGPRTVWAAMVVLVASPCWAQDASPQESQAPVVQTPPPHWAATHAHWAATHDGHAPHHWPVLHTPDLHDGCLWQTYCPDKHYTLQRLHELNHQYRQLRRHIGPTGKGYGVDPFDVLKPLFKGTCNGVCFGDSLVDASWDQTAGCPCNSSGMANDSSFTEDAIENPSMPSPPNYSPEPPVNLAPPADPSPPRNELPIKNKPRTSRHSDYLRTASGLSDFINTYR